MSTQNQTLPIENSSLVLPTPSLQVIGYDIASHPPNCTEPAGPGLVPESPKDALKVDNAPEEQVNVPEVQGNTLDAEDMTLDAEDMTLEEENSALTADVKTLEVEVADLKFHNKNLVDLNNHLNREHESLKSKLEFAELDRGYWEARAGSYHRLNSVLEKNSRHLDAIAKTLDSGKTETIHQLKAQLEAEHNRGKYLMQKVNELHHLLDITRAPHDKRNRTVNLE
ncbi:hypothetical protein CcaverHIS002_0102630 [Cutaneotrichosporon cavernicola]|uniref:Uncharacterized protein n=1 Tax=Cutaneotrichosporon cavernicola TaxID=279322 RepID=A0AA48I0Z6_9TREE|nr:uncharacterized protein CcaverHIS019_0102570 [Cutaneotrichosporon cavernicola]BEI79734.1 hypothetical protein CcaverHIS002_0102630 [Cutaneotrichosporon cavernicola]BEI87539.1 hypothetical protein CcaverHIS019_0102570 [Cutaneotrichosporon cavernicola]BEI95311.1 hypothetical protein CcaverHIS631_0102600 [Cutaneotrichosporon cavernicola]BEJ03084.1 hypothetical protein CcaverHIS641_0102590 [Cutaneotrichosporon cavernicola]